MSNNNKCTKVLKFLQIIVTFLHKWLFSLGIVTNTVGLTQTGMDPMDAFLNAGKKIMKLLNKWVYTPKPTKSKIPGVQKLEYLIRQVRKKGNVANAASTGTSTIHRFFVLPLIAFTIRSSYDDIKTSYELFMRAIQNSNQVQWRNYTKKVLGTYTFLQSIFMFAALCLLSISFFVHGSGTTNVIDGTSAYYLAHWLQQFIALTMEKILYLNRNNKQKQLNVNGHFCYST
jgi:hypothetical protein